MKIEIEIDDVEILETFESYDKEYANSKDPKHRRWGRMSWIYPGEFVAQISGRSAAAIKLAMTKT